MAICEHCGSENPEGFRFCGGCGSPLPQTAAPRQTRKIVTRAALRPRGGAIGDRAVPHVECRGGRHQPDHYPPSPRSSLPLPRADREAAGRSARSAADTAFQREFVVQQGQGQTRARPRLGSARSRAGGAFGGARRGRTVCRQGRSARSARRRGAARAAERALTAAAGVSDVARAKRAEPRGWPGYGPRRDRRRLPRSSQRASRPGVSGRSRRARQRRRVPTQRKCCPVRRRGTAPK